MQFYYYNHCYYFCYTFQIAFCIDLLPQISNLDIFLKIKVIASRHSYIEIRLNLIWGQIQFFPFLFNSKKNY